MLSVSLSLLSSNYSTVEIRLKRLEMNEEMICSKLNYLMIVDFRISSMEYRTIDLDKAEQAVIQVTGDAQKGYQPQTLRPQNGGRSIYLPSFPSDSKMPAECLLLSNVPGKWF